MPQFFWAFMGEGNTDYASIQNIVARTIDRLLFPLGYDTVAADIPLPLQGNKQADKIVEAAHHVRGLNLLVVHLDADNRNETNAYEQRFRPGYEAVQKSSKALSHIIPVIPIRTSEAWMLADFKAFKETVGTNKTAAELGFPSNAKAVETLDAKAVFEQAVRSARPNSKRRRVNIADVHQALSLRVSLTRMEDVPAYQRFVQRLKNGLPHHIRQQL